MTFDWKWDFAIEILPRLLRATLNTLMAAGVGYAIAMVLGLVFALAVLKVGFVKGIFQWLSDRFVGLINLSHQGTDFLFGNLAKPDMNWGYVFAIQVLPNIIFFAALSSILYYSI